MSYKSTINTAARYFEVISGIIIGIYWTNPTGKVDPVCLDDFLSMRELTVTQSGLKAHIWVKEQLAYAISRWYKSGAPVIALAQQVILDFYKSINLEEYLVQSRNEVLRKRLDYFQQRFRDAERDGDEDLMNYAERSAEIIATAISRGITAKEVTEDVYFMAKLDRMYGDYNPFHFETGEDP